MRPVKNPLDVPVIRRRLALFLDSNDAIACTQVCKTWSDDFAARVWHTIDVKEQTKIKELNRRIVAKNGHHIRVIKNIKKRSELGIFQHASVCNVESLTIRLKPKHGYQQQTADLIRQNICTLTKLDLSGDDSKDERTEFVLAEALSAPGADSSTQSVLTKISLRYLRMSRDSFSILLSSCPQLEHLEVRYCTMTDNENAHLFHHQKLSYLFASIEQVFRSGPEQASSTPLLAHFPSLEAWETWSFEEVLEEPTIDTLRQSIQEHCPRLKKVYTSDSPGAMVHELLTKAFKQLEMVCFIYDSITPVVALGILHHQATLRTLRTYEPSTADWSYHADRVFPLSDNISDGWMVHLMLSRCPMLEIVDLPSHEMDLNMMDRFPWACENLQQLRIRIRGLDTKHLIKAVISKWYVGRRCGSAAARRVKEAGHAAKKDAIAGEGAAVEAKELTSGGADTILTLHAPVPTAEGRIIVDRVAKHLLKFKKLNRVWLGYQEWTI
ncbi:hypothetical protein EDD11_002782 [Mortierella claussenii]|nr:hypothetical protein EDD11_002782 [Mortierella claussenii]